MASENTTSTALDQRKRALEALERRFSTAKEIDHDQINNKRCLKEGQKVEGAQGKRALDPAYHDLFGNVNENLMRPAAELSSRKSSINKIVHNLLRNGDFSHKYMQRSKGMKVDNWFLLDNFVPNKVSSLNARAKVLQSRSKRSKKHMSIRQHRKYGSFILPQEFHKFDLYKPMHEMWKEYIIKLLKSSGTNQIPQRILAADLHGSILSVVECKASKFTGINGIMIRETVETFGIISEDDKFHVVPKKGSVFIFQADYWKITLHGDKLSLRNIT